MRTLKKSYRDSVGYYTKDEDCNDLAVVELETEVKGVNPAKLYDNDNELGKRAIMAGYGEIERADEYNSEKSLHKRRKMGGENVIDSIGGFKVGNNLAGLFFDFDGPNSKKFNRMGDSDPLPLEYFVDGGDCGSGLFLSKYGAWKLAGLCASPDYPSEYDSYGDKYGKYYGFNCYYIKIFAFQDWINNQIRNRN